MIRNFWAWINHQKKLPEKSGPMQMDEARFWWNADEWLRTTRSRSVNSNKPWNQLCFFSSTSEEDFIEWNFEGWIWNGSKDWALCSYHILSTLESLSKRDSFRHGIGPHGLEIPSFSPILTDDVWVGYKLSPALTSVTSCKQLWQLLQAVASYDSCYELSTILTAVTSCCQLWQLLQGVTSFDICYKLSPALTVVTGCWQLSERLLQLNVTYMKLILHLVPVKIIILKSSYNWFKIDNN